jgi:hypothetical protein
MYPAAVPAIKGNPILSSNRLRLAEPYFNVIRNGEYSHPLNDVMGICSDSLAMYVSGVSMYTIVNTLATANSLRCFDCMPPMLPILAARPIKAGYNNTSL